MMRGNVALNVSPQISEQNHHHLRLLLLRLLLNFPRIQYSFFVENLFVDHLLELSEDLAFSLLPLLVVEHEQSSLLVGGINLVLFPETDGLHSAMTRSRHDEAHVLVRHDLVGS